ncbi:MAG: hypothetical protein IKJ38_07950, partial [Alistipes sp.]|nr:hypothetical protein [Alistipes sp.]
FKELYSNFHQNFHHQPLNFLEWKSGAKVRTIFETTKFLVNFFQKTFLRTFFAIRRFRGESGCKDKSSF